MKKSAQLKTPLINTTVLQIQSEVAEQTAFISRYNQVINAYNKYAEEGSPKMEVMVGNKFINKISQCLNNPLYIVLLTLVMLIVPVVNLFCLACIFAYLLYLKRENKKHVRNVSRVSDPFEHFFFAQEMCQIIGKHYATIDLQHNQIKDFTYNQELRQKLSKKLQQKGAGRQNKLTVLIYDQHFYDSFTLYKKEFYKTLIWLTASIFIVSISMILYISILTGE